MPKPKLLFHVCCAPCSGFLSQELSKKFQLAVYFENSNLWPEEEFLRRSAEAQNFFKEQGADFVLAQCRHNDWLKFISGLEREPEKGKRCQLCYYYRLAEAAKYAAANSFDYLTTSLLISPWKDSRTIAKLGSALAKKYYLEFLADDFLSPDNYRLARAFAKEQGFYFQRYCGCEFSLPSP